MISSCEYFVYEADGTSDRLMVIPLSTDNSQRHLRKNTVRKKKDFQPASGCFVEHIINFDPDNLVKK